MSRFIYNILCVCVCIIIIYLLCIKYFAAAQQHNSIVHSGTTPKNNFIKTDESKNKKQFNIHFEKAAMNVTLIYFPTTKIRECFFSFYPIFEDLFNFITLINGIVLTHLKNNNS